MKLVRGVYGILATTYDAGDEPLLTDLTRQADFVASTAQGVVWPVMSSQFYLLGYDEIEAGFRAVARGIRGRVPFVAGVSRLTRRESVALAETARGARADAVIALPPWMTRVTGRDLVGHFRAIAEVGLPIMLQNAGDLSRFSAIDEDDLRLVLDQVPEIVALKDEAPVLPQTISRGVRLMPPDRGLVFGGGGGRFLLDELRRGGAGNLPGCCWADLLGATFKAWSDGDAKRARSLHAMAQVGESAIKAYGPAAVRWVLHHRGITESERGRFDAAGSLDDAARTELNATLMELTPSLPWQQA